MTPQFLLHVQKNAFSEGCIALKSGVPAPTQLPEPLSGKESIRASGPRSVDDMRFWKLGRPDRTCRGVVSGNAVSQPLLETPLEGQW